MSVKNDPFAPGREAPQVLAQKTSTSGRVWKLQRNILGKKESYILRKFSVLSDGSQTALANGIRFEDEDDMDIILELIVEAKKIVTKKKKLPSKI